jgi:predicted  nucleic acid-binding Zn-ribbon protein
MTRASALMRLQQVDSEIDAVRARLAEIEAELAQDRGRAAAGARLSASQAALAATRRALRVQEAEIQSLAAKAAEVETRLYSGKVTNPKELQDIQEELASLRRRRAALEDQMLESMVQVESDESVEQAARQVVTAAEGAVQTANEALAADKARAETALARLLIDREGAEAPISAADRETYASLRRRKRGLAVARLDEGVCSACGVAPSSSRAQAARHGDELILCGNCERILYAG